MIAALVRKELRGLLPLIAALLAIELLGLTDMLLLKFPDELSWRELSSLMGHEGSEFVVALVLVVAVIATYLLYPHEIDQGTITFLYSLPIGRSTIFLAKVGAATLVVLGFCLLDTLLGVALLELNTSSMSGAQLRAEYWALELAMMSGVGLIGIGYGMLISFFRRLGVVVAVVLVGALEALPGLVPALSSASPLTLFQVEFIGQEVLVDPAPWRLHGIAAMLSLLLAWRLWRDHGERVNTTTAPPVRRVTRILVAVAIAAIAVPSVIMLYWSQRVDPLADLGDEADPISLHTHHYAFRYLPSDREGALALSAIADAAYERVRERLGAQVAGRIAADLTEVSPEHQGIAGWQTLHIERGVLTDPLLSAHVLYHETTHVLSATESRRRLFDNAASAAFFSEGLAEWVAHQLHDHRVAREALLDQAAAAWQRFDIGFDDLVDAASFTARHDEWLVYALGYAWVQSLASECGDAAPGDALRAMARPEAPRDLPGRRLWQDTLQSIGCDLAAVNATLARTLAARPISERELPRLRAEVVQYSDALLVVEVAVSSPDPDREYDVTVRARDSARASRGSITYAATTVRSGQPALVYLSDHALSGQRFQLQAGVYFAQDEPPFFERWNAATR